MIEKLRLIKFEHIIYICPTQSVLHVAFVAIHMCMSIHADIIGSYIVLGVVAEDCTHIGVAYNVVLNLLFYIEGMHFLCT